MSNSYAPTPAEFDEDLVREAIKNSSADDKDELLKLLDAEMASGKEDKVELSQNLQRRLATLFALEEQYQEKDVSASALRIKTLQEEADTGPTLDAQDEANIAEIFTALENGQAEILQELEKNAKKQNTKEEADVRMSEDEDYRKIMEKLKQKNA